MPQASLTPDKSGKMSLPKLVSLWLTLFAVVLTAGIVTVVQLNAAQFSAQTFAQRYIDALRSGDGGTALGLLTDPTVTGDAALLDGDALRASMARMENIQVGQARAEEKDAVVPVSYTLDGHHHEVQLHVRHEGHNWLFFDRWSMQEPLSHVSVSTDANVSRILVNGTPAPVEDAKASLATFIPATVNITDDGKYLAAESKTLSVESAGKSVPAELDTGPTDELIKAVQKDINDYLDKCAEQKVLQPTGCPLSHNTIERVDPTTIEWEISDYPKVKIEEDGDGWDVPVLDFQARIKYTGIDLMTGEAKKQNINMNSEVDADLKLAPNQYYVKPFATKRWLEATSGY